MPATAIYTVLTGDKEPIGNPIARLSSRYTDLDIRLICFTDNPKLSSDTWEIRLMDTHSLPPEKSSRRPKAMPHVYLPDYQYSLYIDNICELKRYPTSQDLKPKQTSNYLYRLFKHSSRQSLIEEALAVASLGYEKADILINQLHAYEKQLPLNSISPLSTCTVLLREHNHNEIKSHGILWWEHILNFSKRDQLSFDYCRQITKTQVDYFNGTKFENDLIWPHNNASGNRVLASFDKEKFDWLQKRGHQQKISEHDNDHYQSEIRALSNHKSVELELLAYLVRSPIGEFHMPRLGLTDTLQPILAPRRGRIKTVLGVHQNRDSSLSLNEFTASMKAIALYLQTEIVNLIPRESIAKSTVAKLPTSNLIVLNEHQSDVGLESIATCELSKNYRTLYHSTAFTIISNHDSD